jgi:hypothetical protein
VQLIVGESFVLTRINRGTVDSLQHLLPSQNKHKTHDRKGGERDMSCNGVGMVESERGGNRRLGAKGGHFSHVL